MDEFHLPCSHPTFESGFFENGVGWRKGEEAVCRWASSHAYRGMGGTALLMGEEHLTFLWSERPHLPGAKVQRLVRTGPSGWFVYGWWSGLRPGAADLDPPFSVAAMTAEQWRVREREVLVLGRRSALWQAEANRCKHRQCRGEASVPPPGPGEESAQPATPVLQEESGAFFWFNSRAISHAGNPMYGRVVYEHFLPLLAPAKQNHSKARFVLFDGDCMVESQRLISYFRPQDTALLDEARSIGEGLSYVVAVLGQGARTWDEMDAALRQEAVLGYMGMTLPVRFDQDTFLACREVMALVAAARIDGPRFRKINYEYHADDELKRMGFEPCGEE